MRYRSPYLLRGNFPALQRRRTFYTAFVAMQSRLLRVVFNRAKFTGADLALVETHTRLLQRNRAQEAADHVSPDCLEVTHYSSQPHHERLALCLKCGKRCKRGGGANEGSIICSAHHAKRNSPRLSGPADFKAERRRRGGVPVLSGPVCRNTAL